MCETSVEGGYLCPGCRLATGQRLDRMPRLYTALGAFLHPGGRRPEMGGSRPAEPPLPIAEPAFNLRGPGGIVGVLEDWRSAMQQERGWREPAATGLMEGRIIRAARGLHMNLDWIAGEWPQAGAFALEVRDLERDVVSIVNPLDPRSRPIRVGKCPAADESGAVCGAILRYVPGESTITCRWCNCVFPPAAWAGLNEWMEHDATEESGRALLA
jgi:hypothetical protein